jgi:TonB family protein
MNRTLHLAMAVLVSCYGVVSFAQTTTSPTEQKPAPPAASSDKKQEPPASNSNTQGPTQPDTAKMGADYGLGTTTAKMGPMEVFTDTMGVDFKPYLQQVVLPTVRKNWYNLIPESAKFPAMKKGKVTIAFAIRKDGTVSGMKLLSTSGDVALDRGAWSGITACNPFPPLPSEFSGGYIGLRFSFYYNPQKADLDAAPASPTGQSSSKSEIKVSIISPLPSVRVKLGASEVVDATVTGSTNTAVKWSVTGMGCSGLRHNEWGHVSGSDCAPQSTFGSVDGYVASRSQSIGFGYSSTCATRLIPLNLFSQRKAESRHGCAKDKRAKLAEDQSRKSLGVARCRLPEMWEADSACRSATHRL